MFVQIVKTVFSVEKKVGKNVKHDANIPVPVQEIFFSVCLIIIYVPSCRTFFRLLYLVYLCK